MLHAGVVWRLNERLLLWPGIYADLIDNRAEYPQQPERDGLDDGLRSKITCPMEIRFAEDSSLTLNLALRLDDVRSGGGNVQIILPM